MLFQILMISVCLSIDAFGIGVSYVVKGVRIGFISRIMIGMMSALVMHISMVAGDICLQFFPETVMKIIGCSILFLIGITFIKNSLFGEEADKYDFNKSCAIEWTEAVVLGLALSADAFSAGFAVSALDVSSKIVPVCVGLMQIGFLYAGSFTALKCKALNQVNAKVCGVCSGCLLILIAVLKSF